MDPQTIQGLKRSIAQAPEDSWELACLEFLVYGKSPPPKFRNLGNQRLYVGPTLNFFFELHPKGAMIVEYYFNLREIGLMSYNQSVFPKGSSGFMAHSFSTRNSGQSQIIKIHEPHKTLAESLKELYKPLTFFDFVTGTDQRLVTLESTVFVPEDWNRSELAYAFNQFIADNTGKNDGLGFISRIPEALDRFQELKTQKWAEPYYSLIKSMNLLRK